MQCPLGANADISECPSDVRFTPKSGSGRNQISGIDSSAPTRTTLKLLRPKFALVPIVQIDLTLALITRSDEYVRMSAFGTLRTRTIECLLCGVKQTWIGAALMSLIAPKADSHPGSMLGFQTRDVRMAHRCDEELQA